MRSDCPSSAAEPLQFTRTFFAIGIDKYPLAGEESESSSPFPDVAQALPVDAPLTPQRRGAALGWTQQKDCVLPMPADLGNITPSTIEAIAEVIGMDPWDLLRALARAFDESSQVHA